jgi:hypothetical protein
MIHEEEDALFGSKKSAKTGIGRFSRGHDGVPCEKDARVCAK